MFEWDCGSYNRKFSYSISNCKVGDEPPSWRKIVEINQEGLVFSREEDDPIGQVVFEQISDKFITRLPLVTFNYVPIEACAYAHSVHANWFYVLQRRHLKSYKIGLSSEGYDIFEFMPGSPPVRKDYRVDINLDKPLTRAEFKNRVVLNSNLIIDGKSLKAYGSTIGFLEAGRAILKDPAFKPLVKPLLGDAWVIVDL